MDQSIIIGGAISAVIIIWAIIEYNKLVGLRMDVYRQTSHVEVHLKKKYDMIPALVECVKGYATHEKSVLEDVTRLRTDWQRSKSPAEKVRASNLLDSAISRLLIVQERYPNLKADRSFRNIFFSITRVEQELVHERKVYNKRVSWYNETLQKFPTVLIAKITGFQEGMFFTMEKEND